MDRQQMISELQRHDSDVPLEGIGLPKKWREKMELPDQFLRAATLREGTWVSVVSLNAVALALAGYLLACLYPMRKAADKWWHNRFKDDFDFYYMNEHKDLVDHYWPLWVNFAWAIIAVKLVYFFTGMLAIYALVKKTVHPYWYMPWMIWTALLVAASWITAFCMIIMIFVLLTFRPLTVTWDIVPIACIIGYNVCWTYCWFVVIAHYKRRWIVKYWRDRGVTGMDFVKQFESQKESDPTAY